MGTCNCGGKTVKFKTATIKKANVKKANIKKGSSKDVGKQAQVLSQAQIKATKAATKKAKANATGCKCTQ